MQYKIIAISTDNKQVLDVVNRALIAYKKEVGDTTNFVIIPFPVTGKSSKGFESMIVETHRVAQTARKGVRGADLGIGIAEGDAELLIRKGARRIKLKTWPIMGVIEHGPIALALPQRFSAHLSDPIADAVRTPYIALQKPECRDVTGSEIAAATLIVAAWAEMKFPTSEPIEEILG